MLSFTHVLQRKLVSITSTLGSVITGSTRAPYRSMIARKPSAGNGEN